MDCVYSADVSAYLEMYTEFIMMDKTRLRAISGILVLNGFDLEFKTMPTEAKFFRIA